MPAFSRTETLLIKRFDSEGHIYPKGVTANDSVNVAMPFLCVKLSISRRASFDDNIFVKTISALYDIRAKEGYSYEQAVEDIVEKTALDRIVVKTILKKKRQNTDVVTHAVQLPEEQKTVYLLYDPISKQFLPSCIAKEDFDLFSAVEVKSVEPNTKRHDLSFSLQIQYQRERALMLGLGENDSGWAAYESLTAPAKVPVKILEDIKKDLNRDGENVVVNDVGEWQSLWLICNCSVNNDDLSSIAVESPLSVRYARPLFATIRSTVDSNPAANRELAGGLSRLDKIRQQHLESAATFFDEQQDAKIWIIQRYPDLAQYQSVMSKVATFVARFPKDDMDDKTGSLALANSWTVEKREDVTRDFHSAMEYVFAAAVKKRYPTEHADKILDACNVLDKPRPRGFAGYFIPMAVSVGFPQNDSEMFFRDNKVRQDQVRSILKAANPMTDSSGQRMQFGLTELVVAMMIEAAVDVSHPFRNIAKKCPNLFEVMVQSRKWRNYIKHKEEQKPDPLSVDELYRMRALLSLCVELLARRNSKSEQVQTANLLNGRKAAKIKADSEMEAYHALRTLEATRQRAWDVSFDYYFQDTEYFSECYNLLANGLYYELLNRFDCPNGEKTIDTVFAGESDTVWPRILSIYDKYGCKYIKEIPPPRTTDLFHDQRDIMKWSLRNKIAVIFATYDADRPNLLAKITSVAPDIVYLTDMVHLCRGHNNDADFSGYNDGYIQYQSLSEGGQSSGDPPMRVDVGFHRQLLDMCESISKIILEEE